MPDLGYLKTRLELYTCYALDKVTGCMLANKPSAVTGYGSITIDKQQYLLHRLAAAIYLGLDLEDSNQFACHKDTCKNRNCFNWEHLYKGSRSTNMTDAARLKTHRESRKTHCKYGHEYTLENTYRIPSNPNKRYCLMCRKTTYKQSKNI